MSKALQGIVMVLLSVAVGWFGGYYIMSVKAAQELPAKPTPLLLPELSGDPYLDDIQHLTWLLRERWSWLEMRAAQGLDLGALEAEAKTLLLAEPGERGFLRALTRYVAGLSDGHGHAELAGVDLGEQRQWPFTLIEVTEGIMVDGIGPAIFKSKALKRGDLILAVDGVPIDEVIRDQERFVIRSTPAARRRKALFDLTEASSKESLTVRAQRMGESEEVTLEVPCLLQSEPVPRRSWRPIKPGYKDLDTETAYYCVGSFAPLEAGFAEAEPAARHEILAPQYDAYAEVFEGIASKQTLLLDLRGNGGGTDLLGQALALHLMDPGFHYLRLEAKRNGLWHRTPWQDPQVGRGTPRFGGRVICLIDERSFSVTDNFAACLRDERLNVLFVGQPTGGGSGAPRSFTLPSTKARVRFCTMRVFAPDGTFIEGNGVLPNVLVRASRAQLLAGEDAILEAALAAR